jgi:hypothetical protein
MKKQNKSPFKFAGIAANVVSGGGGGYNNTSSSFDGADFQSWVKKSGNSPFDLGGYIRYRDETKAQEVTSELAQNISNNREQTSFSSVGSNNGTSPTAPAAMGSAPAPATMGSADNANPFGGRTFTISPAQMRNVQNVFGDTNERQASVGQDMGQSSENYDAYGEESPLMKKSCGSYKK